MESVWNSHFARFWRQFSYDFDVWPCKSKLMTSSTRMWSNITTRGYKAPKNSKNVPKIANVGTFLQFKAPYRLPSGNITSYSCRGGHKLRFAWSYIKIGQVLKSEMRKMWSKWQMLISLKRDKISKFQVHIWNQQQILHLIDVVL